MPIRKIILSLLLSSVLAAGAALAQSMNGWMPPSAPEPKAAAAATAQAPRLADTFGVAPLARLQQVDQAAPDELAALRAWNAARHVPLKNGLVRSLPAPQRVELTADLLSRSASPYAGGFLAAPTFDRLAWGAAVTVDHAYRLRLHLDQVHLPAGTRLWVYGDGETRGPFGAELVGPGGDLWTPSVAGESAKIDVDLPAAALAAGQTYSFTIDRVAELVQVTPYDQNIVGADDLSCNLDAECYTKKDLPFIESYRHAVARLEFVSQGDTFLCSGGLLNSNNGHGTIPYLLTANHCISAPDEAASVEAFWDYYTESCNGQGPALSSVPRSNGATLLATSDNSDFTLLRLATIPAGRFMLGWNASPNAAPNGTLLYRISHPEGLTQNYVVTRSSSTVPDCGGPRPNFLYSTFVTGGTFGGSSGSPLVLANGQVVGELYGGCNDPDDCSPNQYTIDGAFTVSYPSLQPFLAPTNGHCTPGPNTLCLLSNRFQVQVAWQNQFDGSSGSGRQVKRTDSTGFFYFFDPSNYELSVKILDFGTAVKVFYGELTNLKFTITITDTKTGTVKTYQNTAGDCGGLDQAAFASTKRATATGADTLVSHGAPASGTCVPGPGTLCLLDRRLAVKGTWSNQFDGSSGAAVPVSLTTQSGYFTFNDPTSVELVAKAVDFTDRIAFFYGSLSNLQYTLTVTDTTTGAVKTYDNPAGTYCGGLDNNAF